MTPEQGENAQRKRTEHAEREFGEYDPRPQKGQIQRCQLADVDHDTRRRFVEIVASQAGFKVISFRPPNVGDLPDKVSLSAFPKGLRDLSAANNESDCRECEKTSARNARIYRGVHGTRFFVLVSWAPLRL